LTHLRLAGVFGPDYGSRTPATIVSDSATQIVTQVPTGAATGRITVTTPAGTAASQASFTV
jgi:hypothetical protein